LPNKNGICLKKLNRWQNSVLQTVNEYIIAFEDQKEEILMQLEKHKLEIQRITVPS
jgi:hypothetical protein